MNSFVASELPSKAKSACRKLRHSAWVVLVACAIMQTFIEPSIVNITSVLLVLTASLLTFHFVIRGTVIRSIPLPALVVLGFNLATLSGALIAQSFSLRALVFNLKVPLVTFGACTLFQLSLLGTFLIFLNSTSLRTLSRRINLRALKPLGVMKAPEPAQLWMMGLLGMGAMVLSFTSGQSKEVEFGDVGSKFFAGLTYLAYAPFLIPILRFVFPSTKAPSVLSRWILLGYFVLLVMLGVAKNSRGTFAISVANLGLTALLLILLGQLPITQWLRRWFIAGALVVLMIMPMASDLAVAMVLVRGERSDISSSELVLRTFDALQDKSAIEQYRRVATVLLGGGEYSENYIDNPFLARFINTKFVDNTVSLRVVTSTARSAEVWAITFDKLLAFLPTTVLKLISSDVDKRNLKFSMGDALYAQQFGTGLGGYRVGSPVGHGLALMGISVFVFIIPLFLAVFVALQSLTRLAGGFVIISPVILLQFMRLYYLAAGDSLLDTIGFMLRTLPQDILLYAIVFQITRWAASSSRRQRHFQRIGAVPAANAGIARRDQMKHPIAQ